MAIVLDEYGGTAGIVTLQDLIVEIVGDIIEDDRDDEEEIIKFRDNEYIVNGSAKLDDVNEVLGTNFEFEDVESVSYTHLCERLKRKLALQSKRRII